ncbi:CYTH domain-containing protein [Patescibacteria group bacterium]|nr:CYTH domain-containing protein [Patescibacteria group bacterium]MBU1705212.1 CYTH domain-containing protein [Patescibacteria group bacterium]
MIEVEKKFQLSPEEEAKLIAGAQFVKEVTNTDTYFDNEQYDLTANGLWLRQRNDRFELKVNVSKKLNELGRPDWNTTEFKELETDDEIREELHLGNTGNIADDIAMAGYEPFVTLKTERKMYQKDDYVISIDTIDYGYHVVEIELMVETQKEVEAASEQIVKYAESVGINNDPVRGKVMEYLYRNNPEHYNLISNPL